MSRKRKESSAGSYIVSNDTWDVDGVGSMFSLFFPAFFLNVVVCTGNSKTVKKKYVDLQKPLNGFLLIKASKN